VETEKKQIIYVVSWAPSYDSNASSGFVWSAKRDDMLVAAFKHYTDGVDLRFFELRLPAWVGEGDHIEQFLKANEDTLVHPIDPTEDPRCDLDDALIEYALENGRCRDGGDHEPGRKPSVDAQGDGFTITVGCKKCNRESTVFVDVEMFEDWDE
jgi:hypothetical protein